MRTINYFGNDAKDQKLSYNFHSSAEGDEVLPSLSAEGDEVLPSLSELINYSIKESKVETNLISDGYHTFGELYEHRITNFLVLCRVISYINPRPGYTIPKVWRSLKHSDGELAYGGTWFVLGLNTEPGEQITYHLPIEAWDKAYFAETLETAPEWDGHTSADVLNRLAKI